MSTSDSTPPAHRQTRYVAAPQLQEPIALPMPPATASIEEAKADLTEYGVCVLTDVLSSAETEVLRERLDEQAAAERALGELAPVEAHDVKQGLSNLVNKGAEFLALVERKETEELAGYLLGKNFLLSSLTGAVFHGPTEKPQPLHRDQGQVPATADFPANCNCFYLLDDFTEARGGTHVIPGSHRWLPDFQVEPPSRDMIVPVIAPAGSVVCWDGRLWHGTGVNAEGHQRRHVAAFCCLPWTRQQENWGVSCLQEVIDSASPTLRARLGLRTYGTLGMINGTNTTGSAAARHLGSFDVEIPDYIIGEQGQLHPVKRVQRAPHND